MSEKNHKIVAKNLIAVMNNIRFPVLGNNLLHYLSFSGVMKNEITSKIFPPDYVVVRSTHQGYTENKFGLEFIFGATQFSLNMPSSILPPNSHSETC